MANAVDIDYLNAAAAQIQHVKRRTYLRMAAAAGSRVLDVGCGPGIDTLALAAVVGPTGSVHGIDADESMVRAARMAADEAGVSDFVSHELGDAGALPYADSSFDACRSERLFQHLSDPSAALAEMTRVTRAGGALVVVDTDWATLSIGAGKISTERLIARMRPERTLANGYVARGLPGLFQRVGLVEVDVEVFVAQSAHLGLARQMAVLDEAEQVAIAEGLLSEKEVEEWRADLAAAHNAGNFYASVTIVAVTGRRAA